MSKDTAIVGDGESQLFLYSNGAAKEKEQKGQMRRGLAAALVFAKEKESSHGPVYKDVRVFGAYRTVEENGHEWNTMLTARREGFVEMIGGQE
ncbi:hypothetical protein Sjap_015868 [Stephania japonica]|uniref:Uncharacterized protein n=1 Tax=Stephania japonica TaxID=461633 RepID=A0AAP0NUE2_9MAGN